MDYNDMGQEAEGIAENIVSDIRELPINSLLLSGLTGIGIMSVFSYCRIFFSSQKIAYGFF